MSFLKHRSLSGTVAAVVLFALVLGGCLAACAQPLVTKAASHPCCDPKGSCKPAPVKVAHNDCDRAQADMPGKVLLQVHLQVSTLPVLSHGTVQPGTDRAGTISFAVSPPLTPLSQSSLLRI